MFALNEKVVYPGHGVARVSRIIEKIVASRVTHFYELKFIHKDMTILVPVDNLEAVGVRCLSTPAALQEVYKILAEPMGRHPLDDISITSWNKRSKRYQTMLRSGCVVEFAKIYRDLQAVARFKTLSFGERALLAQTELLLVEEIALVDNSTPEEVLAHLRSAFAHAGPYASAGGQEPTQTV